MPETYLPILLDWKAEHLRKATGDERYVSKHGEESSFFGRLKAVLPLSVKPAVSGTAPCSGRSRTQVRLEVI